MTEVSAIPTILADVTVVDEQEVLNQGTTNDENSLQMGYKKIFYMALNKGENYDNIN